MEINLGIVVLGVVVSLVVIMGLYLSCIDG